MFDHRKAKLLLRFLTGRVPVEVKNFLERTNPILGGAMAIQTPAHAVWLGVFDDIHLVDLPMAFVATHAAIHMHGVVEINIVRRLVNPHPGNRFPALETCADRRKQGAVRFYGAVATHAHVGGRDVRVFRNLHVCVAVAAVDPKLSRMQAVFERHRLIGRVTDTRVFRGRIIGDASQSDRTKHDEENNDL